MAEELSATILIADDNRLVQELLRDAFVDAGYAVITASSGREALERVGESRPDLVITDGEMPEMDGWTLCEHLKSDPHTEDVPVLFLAAEREVHHRMRGLRAGAYDYLCKPFSTEEILLRVRLILERVGQGAVGREAPRAYLAGHTSHFSTPDLVQLLAMNGRTGCLRLRGPELGRLHFREGRVVGAFTARAQGVKALRRMLTWSDCDFHFEPHDDPAVDQELDESPQSLLMDALVANDDLKRLLDALPDPALRVALTPAGEGDEGEREGAALGELGVRILTALRARPALGVLFDDFDAPDVEIARIVKRLLEKDLARPLPGYSPGPR